MTPVDAAAVDEGHWLLDDDLDAVSADDLNTYRLVAADTLGRLMYGHGRVAGERDPGVGRVEDGQELVIASTRGHLPSFATVMLVLLTVIVAVETGATGPVSGISRPRHATTSIWEAHCSNTD